MSKYLEELGLAALCSNIKAYVMNAIPTKVSDLTNDSGFITGVSWSQVTSKPTFATVATSGSYADLSNKPTIPTVPSAMTASEASTGTATTARTITAKVLSDLIDDKISAITDGDGVSY